jgi:hypothetical protein
MNVWEVPSSGSMAQVAGATKALDDAMREADQVLNRVTNVNNQLRSSGLSIVVQ